MMSSPVILVIGATGHQGGAVVKALQNTQFNVRALVRSEKGLPDYLKQPHVEVVRGDLDDNESLRAAMKNIYGVFSVMAFVKGGKGAAIERARAMRVIDVAKTAGVNHFIYSSAGASGRHSGIDRWDFKYEVERYLGKSNLRFTILRPTSLMENFTMTAPALMASMYRAALRGKTIQMVASDDIGKWAALTFEHRTNYASCTIELAGDELTAWQMRTILEKVTQKKLHLPPLPRAILRIMGTGGRMLLWEGDHGYRANIPELRRAVPNMLRFEDWSIIHLDPSKK